MSLTQPELLNLPRNLVKSYRRFYRASTRYNPSSRSILKPMTTAKETIKFLAPTLTSLKDQNIETYATALVDAVAAAIFKDLAAIRDKHAQGFAQIKNLRLQNTCVIEFSRLYVEEVFINHFQCQTSELYSEKAIGLIEDTCEFIYRLMQDNENQTRKSVNESNIDSFQDFPGFAELPNIEIEDRWSVSVNSSTEILICGPGFLEMLIKKEEDATFQKEENDFITQEIVTQPLPNSERLELIITTNESKTLSKLYLGSNISWILPNTFAFELKNALLAEEYFEFEIAE